MLRRALLGLVLLAACGDDAPPPVDVAAGRLTARIASSPAQITLLLDGAEVWSTRAGGQPGEDAHAPPHGFAAIGSRATTVEMMYGSFKFTEQKSAEVWRAIDELGDVTATADGATFTLLADGDQVGTGKLVFHPETKSGEMPDAAGFPRHVQIELDAGDVDRIQLATPCPADEHLVGLGGQSFDVDHRGETVPLFVQEEGIGKFDDPDDAYTGLWFFTGRKHSTHTPMPMVLSSKGYALAVKTDARAVFAMGSEVDDASRFEAWDGTLDLNVFVGDGPRGDVAGEAARDALGHMIAWVGKPARPPLSIFAPWIDAIYGSDNVRRIAQKLRDNGIPASALWTEDWRGADDGTFGYALRENWRVARDLYPDFETLASDLNGMGFAFLTYHNSFIDDTADVYAEALAGGYEIKTSAGQPYEFGSITITGSSTLLDLTNPAAVTWAKDVMGEAIDIGSDGWMADFAEWQPTDAVLASGEDALAVHNRYTVDWAKLTSELLTKRPGRLDPMYFMRSAWIGSQPYMQVIWPGDQQTDFSDGDGLPAVIPMGINLGLAGFPYFGSDIAGYMSQGTTPTTEELFYRWTTFGAMQPVMRTHHGRSARENWQWEQDAATTAHFRRWTRLHMQLAAYLWGSSGSFDRDGLPLIRMIALEYPDEPWAWTTIDEYLLGDRILVAPVQVQGATSREVTLPAGTWYSLWGGGAALSGGTQTVSAAVTEIPAFAPAGALIVLYPDGVDTPLPAPALASATTVPEVGGDREVWLFRGTAADPAHARWNDHDGPAGPAEWTWTGRDGALPTAAMFDGAPVTITQANGTAVLTVTGNGTLDFDGGGTLTIQRATPGTVRVVVK